MIHVILKKMNLEKKINNCFLQVQMFATIMMMFFK